MKFLSIVAGAACMTACTIAAERPLATASAAAISERERVLTAPGAREVPLRIYLPRNGCREC
ncbi:MAG: hypothetical protein AAFX58_07585, partial [Pseudomonadota bacterium]